MCQPQSKELGFWVFKTWSDRRVRIWDLLGQGIGDLDSGLTIVKPLGLGLGLGLGIGTGIEIGMGMGNGNEEVPPIPGDNQYNL